ncbi:hypothetical protein QQS21_001917 [Conoideocrella luteorostrata]|uniref:DUF7702 domain-containing protein n=1 Tax=Conoideocrella luteorostrata TaxID=1105319 RepID=A0AAJ0CZ88_9HYPO|nr:hypothetical protein QQS21_001917 [Conoideocrella luteorostrata]
MIRNFAKTLPQNYLTSHIEPRQQKFLMSQSIDTYDLISIVQIVIFAVSLGGAIILCVKHGFTKATGWRYLVVLSLARIIGSGLRLGTISEPDNYALYSGWQTTNGLGLGPLILILFGLLNRLFLSMSNCGQIILKPLHQQLIEILMLLAIVLVIVGGIKSSITVESGQLKVHYSALSHVGIIIMVAVFIMFCLEVAYATVSRSYIPKGENRILLAVVFCIPFVILRLVYSCLIILVGSTSTVGLYLSLSVITEIVVALACEIVGFTLNKALITINSHRQDFGMRRSGH